MRKVLYTFTLVFVLILTLSSCGEDEHTHEFSEWSVIQNATCTIEGTEERTCSCGEKETKPINALGHTEIIDSAVAATCTADGKTEGKHCSVCNEVLIAQTTISALGHTEVIDSAVAATYTTRGKTEGSHCSTCQIILVEQQEISSIWDGKTTVEPSTIVNINGTYYYQINSAEELAFLANPNISDDWAYKYNYILGCNIVLNPTIEYDENGKLLSDPETLNMWNPIGTDSIYTGWSFGKLFDGNGYTISGIYCISSKNYVGLFSKVGTVLNLAVENSYIQGYSTVGGICGYIGNEIENCSFEGVVRGECVGGILGTTDGFCSYTVNNCTNYGTVIGSEYAAGISYWSNRGLSNCTNYGKIISTNGGSAGISAKIRNSSGTLSYCKNYGTINGYENAGGIVALAESEYAGITNCTNYGIITGNSNVGGICGNLHSGTISYCVNMEKIEGASNIGGISGNVVYGNIRSCHNLSPVYGENKVGALVGESDIFNATISQCFYLKSDTINANITGISNLADSVGSCESKDEAFFEN